MLRSSPLGQYGGHPLLRRRPVSKALPAISTHRASTGVDLRLCEAGRSLPIHGVFTAGFTGLCYKGQRPQRRRLLKIADLSIIWQERHRS